MHSQVLALFSFFCVVWSRDIALGSTEGRKIFDEVRQANPALWRQFENVTVIAPDNELISNVVITDMRPEKDGDVQIVDGGAGKKSVTIELKSPTVLRGYDFHIEVYSVPDTVYTDAEEHLNNDDMATTPSIESTELPDRNMEDDTHNNEPMLSNETTELPENATNEEDKESQLAVGTDIDNDSNRPPRETEENESQPDIPEDDTTTISYETSSPSESDESITMDQDATTKLPETPEISPWAEVNPDSSRPARETAFEGSVIASDTQVTDSTESEVNDATTEAVSETTVNDASTEAASETTVNDATTEAASETTLNDATTEAATETTVNDATESDITTQDTITTASYDQFSYTPISYDNSKNIPDYPSLNILDYIKNREALRPIRHTEDDKPETENESSQLSDDAIRSDQLDENTYDSNPSVEETSSTRTEDDTMDLVPPEIDASYSSDFAGSETTEHTVEDSALYDAPREGRGIDFDSDIPEEVTTPAIYTDEESTTTSATTYITTPTLDEDHTIESLDDQLRNTRGARKEYGDENDVNISDEIPQDTSIPNEDSIPSEAEDVKESNRNLMIVNLDELITRDENSKFIFALPIVLVINGENNYPVIKIIAEDASNERGNMDSKLYPTQPSNESLEPSEYDYKSMENETVKKGDMPSEDYDQSQ